jgi:hypothetical protein
MHAQLSSLAHAPHTNQSVDRKKHAVYEDTLNKKNPQRRKAMHALDFYGPASSSASGLSTTAGDDFMSGCCLARSNACLNSS